MVLAGVSAVVFAALTLWLIAGSHRSGGFANRIKPDINSG